MFTDFFFFFHRRNGTLKSFPDQKGQATTYSGRHKTLGKRLPHPFRQLGKSAKGKTDGKGSRFEESSTPGRPTSSDIMQVRFDNKSHYHSIKYTQKWYRIVADSQIHILY